MFQEGVDGLADCYIVGFGEGNGAYHGAFFRFEEGVVESSLVSSWSA